MQLANYFQLAKRLAGSSRSGHHLGRVSYIQLHRKLHRGKILPVQSDERGSLTSRGERVLMRR